jgi:K+ transporter
MVRRLSRAFFQQYRPILDIQAPYELFVQTLPHVPFREDGKALHRWQAALFALMERNAAHVTNFFRLPSESVVEIGYQISI